MKKLRLACLFQLCLTTSFFSAAQTANQLEEFTNTSSTWPTISVLNDKAYYMFANSAYTMWYLYVSDGTVAGTSLLKSFSGQIGYPHKVNDQFLFLGDNDNDDRFEVWTSDGTSGGTVMVNEFAAIGNPSYWPTYYEINGMVFYHYGNSAVSNMYLHKTDGTPGGTAQMNGFSGYITAHHKVDDQYLMLADDDGDDRFEIWTSDGTSGGTVMVNEFAAIGNPSYWPTYYEINGMVFYHYWNAATSNMYLHKTDGTSSGSGQMNGFSGYITAHHKVNNQYLMLADDDGDDRFEIWTSDGTTAGTVMVAEFSAAGNPSYWPTYYEINGMVFYHYWNTATTNMYLHKTDGTSGGSAQMNGFIGYITNHHKVGNQYLMTADDDGDDKIEVWTSDGTSAGTTQLIEFSNASDYHPTYYELDGKVFYQYYNNAGTSWYLYKTTGTSGGSALLKTFTGPITYAHKIDNTYLLLADNDEDGRYEIWRSDGTSGGTTQVIEFTQPGGTWPTEMELLWNNYYHYVNDAYTTWYLYKGSGTTGTTELIENFGGAITLAHNIGDRYMFIGDDDADDRNEIWTVDWPAGVEEHTYGISLAVFPNPGNGQFTVSGFESQVLRYELYSVSGEKIRAADNPYTPGGVLSLDLQNIPSGIYLLNCFTPEQLHTVKLVKQ
jgi:ELWxxDGT repeat protein